MAQQKVYEKLKVETKNKCHKHKVVHMKRILPEQISIQPDYQQEMEKLGEEMLSNMMPLNLSNKSYSKYEVEQSFQQQEKISQNERKRDLKRFEHVQKMEKKDQNEQQDKWFEDKDLFEIQQQIKDEPNSDDQEVLIELNNEDAQEDAKIKLIVKLKQICASPQFFNPKPKHFFDQQQDAGITHSIILREFIQQLFQSFAKKKQFQKKENIKTSDDSSKDLVSQQNDNKIAMGQNEASYDLAQLADDQENDRWVSKEFSHQHTDFTQGHHLFGIPQINLQLTDHNDLNQLQERDVVGNSTQLNKSCKKISSKSKNLRQNKHYAKRYFLLKKMKRIRQRREQVYFNSSKALYIPQVNNRNLRDTLIIKSDDKVYSLQVEFSDMAKANYYYYGGRISEEDIESERERRTTPPGTIDEQQDVMSENIGHSLNLLKKKHGRFALNHPKSSVSIADNKDIKDSRITNLIVMKERIKLIDDGKHINSFKKVYDKLFREFKEQLIHEYSLLKNAYMIEYEENFKANIQDKESHLDQAQELILRKEQEIIETQEKRKRVIQLTEHILQQKYNLFIKRVAVRAMQYFKDIIQRERRIRVYTRNYMYRRNLRLLFGSWRGVSHSWFKERINEEAKSYEHKVTIEKLISWNQNVDAMKIYMVQLQEKIRIEVAAREELAITYEQSLNKGVGQLNNETAVLAENPLIKEISLIVAQELINKSRAEGRPLDQSLTNLLSHAQTQNFQRSGSIRQNY
ncbi:UNKNOWN [Stylonychia lemnae]|uniref:Uncharacterized protein n=1 Tax=Stylonychia lemnae TaxID=5949 RepID=A0A078AHE8_STYLE|nr:UNKNOWN [Stylonychia lemnae]|eukprot:CDW80263.1 UNKNOWN [Stylonychia lemnae]